MDAFNTLYKIDCNGHTEQKNGLTYLSWAWAWAEIKKAYPGSFYTIYENANGWCYHTDGKTCWVKTGVTIVDNENGVVVDGKAGTMTARSNQLEHIEYLPVMDHRNRSIPLDQVTSFDVNKAIQRSLTKAAARHGLGLYIYAGEDIPESDPPKHYCNDCGQEITETVINGKTYSADKMVTATVNRYGTALCMDCKNKRDAAANPTD